MFDGADDAARCCFLLPLLRVPTGHLSGSTRPPFGKWRAQSGEQESVVQERDRQEAERRAEEAKRLEVQAAAIARRQLRESLTWLKTMARQPLGNFHK